MNVVATEAPEDHHVVSIRYAVPYDLTTGTIEAGDDAARARFWTLPEFRRADQNGYPEQVTNVARLLRAARQTLDRHDVRRTGER